MTRDGAGWARARGAGAAVGGVRATVLARGARVRVAQARVRMILTRVRAAQTRVGVARAVRGRLSYRVPAAIAVDFLGRCRVFCVRVGVWTMKGAFTPCASGCRTAIAPAESERST